ncbi:MAG: DUF1573 domain-containing protein [Chitinophagales bacterium]|nr:DUF1573 domain-containing protein [Bacteroidota bacterium]
MKALFLKSTFIAFAVASMSLVSCKEQTTDNTVETTAENARGLDKISTKIVENPTEITFDRDLNDFGEIIQGEKVHTEFKFTNTGKNALIITDAHGSCGCTVPEWPKEPIAPGESGVIKVQFNSANRSGQFNKTVTVTANTLPSSNTILKIKGTIIVPQDK